MNLQGAKAEVRMTVEIVRKDTGKVETAELVGYVNAEDLEKLKGTQNGSDTLDSSPQRGD